MPVGRRSRPSTAPRARDQTRGVRPHGSQHQLIPASERSHRPAPRPPRPQRHETRRRTPHCPAEVGVAIRHVTPSAFGEITTTPASVLTTIHPRLGGKGTATLVPVSLRPGASSRGRSGSATPGFVERAGQYRALATPSRYRSCCASEARSTSGSRPKPRSPAPARSARACRSRSVRRSPAARPVPAETSGTPGAVTPRKPVQPNCSPDQAQRWRHQRQLAARASRVKSNGSS